MGQLKGQTCVVTGASGGLGRCIALTLARAGGKIVIASRNQQASQRVVDEIESFGGKGLSLSTDVTNEAQVQETFAKVLESFGGLDLLINNAGLALGGAPDELSFETWKQVLGVNLDGAFLCSREALKLMKPKRRGRIINIGSVSAKVPRINSAPYTTSKFALEGLTKALALDARPFGISVSILHPGNTDTPIWDSRRSVAEEEGVMNPDEVARLVLAMAALPPDINFLEGTVLPLSMPFLGRG